MKNIRTLLATFLLMIPLLSSAQEKTFDFYYIAHDYTSRIETVCSLLEQKYEMALDSDELAIVFYLPNGENAPFIVRMNLPGDNRQDFDKLLEELRGRYSHDAIAYMDLSQIIDIFNNIDFIDDKGNPNFIRTRLSWLVNSSFWSRNLNESLIAKLYFVLELDKYQGYVTMDIWDSGEKMIRVNDKYPFGRKNLTGEYPFYLLNL